MKAYAEAMKDFVTSNEDIDLEDMAYTLQTGREAMDYRMAFLADSREMLIKALDDYLAEMPNGSIFAAHVKTKKSEIKLFETDHDAKALLQTWIEKKAGESSRAMGERAADRLEQALWGIHASPNQPACLSVRGRVLLAANSRRRTRNHCYSNASIRTDAKALLSA